MIASFRVVILGAIAAVGLERGHIENAIIFSASKTLPLSR